jgi:hypothetical protein
MSEAAQRLVRALVDPASTSYLGAREWNDLILTGRDTGLLARIAVDIQDHRLFDKLPHKARAQLRAACISAESTQTAIRFEVNRVLRALTQSQFPIVLLKGAAYLMAGLPCARGRMLGDLDLMVPRDRIAEAEQALIENGWLPAQMDDYDQRFYREWMHEIPPLRHPKRETPIDLHHTIVPLTSRVKPNAGALIDAAVPLSHSRLRVLAPADMVLHSAVHLFNDEVSKPLRDLFDLYELLRDFRSHAGFLEELLARARLHGLERPLYYAIRYTERIFGLTLPAEFQRATAELAPARLIGIVMDWTFFACVMPSTPQHKRRTSAFARWLLYVRSHWLRMPPLMLARHLTVKATRRVQERWTARDSARVE